MTPSLTVLQPPLGHAHFDDMVEVIHPEIIPGLMELSSCTFIMIFSLHGLYFKNIILVFFIP